MLSRTLARSPSTGAASLRHKSPSPSQLHQQHEGSDAARSTSSSPTAASMSAQQREPHQFAGPSHHYHATSSSSESSPTSPQHHFQQQQGQGQPAHLSAISETTSDAADDDDEDDDEDEDDSDVEDDEEEEDDDDEDDDEELEDEVEGGEGRPRPTRRRRDQQQRSARSDSQGHATDTGPAPSTSAGGTTSVPAPSSSSSPPPASSSQQQQQQHRMPAVLARSLSRLSFSGPNPNATASQQPTPASSAPPAPAGGAAAQSATAKMEQAQAATKSGYLLKRGERRKTWKKRWFVLRGGQLAMYKSDKVRLSARILGGLELTAISHVDAQEYRLLRLIPIADVHACAPIEYKRRPHTFGVVTPRRTFYIQGANETEARSWCAAIERAKHELKLRLLHKQESSNADDSARPSIDSDAQTPSAMTEQQKDHKSAGAQSATPDHAALPSSSQQSPSRAIPIPQPSSGDLGSGRVGARPNVSAAASAGPGTGYSLATTLATSASPHAPSSMGFSLMTPSSSGVLSTSITSAASTATTAGGLAAAPLNYESYMQGAGVRAPPNSLAQQAQPRQQQPQQPAPTMSSTSQTSSQGALELDSIDAGLERVARDRAAHERQQSSPSPPSSRMQHSTSAPAQRQQQHTGGAQATSSSPHVPATGYFAPRQPQSGSTGITPGTAVVSSSDDDDHQVPPLPQQQQQQAQGGTSVTSGTSQPLDPHRVILAGYLMKQGKRKNWRKRWFSLSSEKLVYSRSHMVSHSPLSTVL